MVPPRPPGHLARRRRGGRRCPARHGARRVRRAGLSAAAPHATRREPAAWVRCPTWAPAKGMITQYRLILWDEHTNAVGGADHPGHRRGDPPAPEDPRDVRRGPG